MCRYSLIIVISLFCCNDKTGPQLVEYIDCSKWENWSSKEGVQCGYVVVPEDHSAPKGKKIKIAFAITKVTLSVMGILPFI